jgi:hypothetical protein
VPAARIKLEKHREQVPARRLALPLHLPATATGKEVLMVGESTANVWAALAGLAFLIATMITALCWFCIYYQEAQELNPYAVEPCTTFQMIGDDIPWHTQK